MKFKSTAVPILAQLAGVAALLGGLLMLAGVAWTVLAAGGLLVGWGMAREAGWL